MCARTGKSRFARAVICDSMRMRVPKAREGDLHAMMRRALDSSQIEGHGTSTTTRRVLIVDLLREVMGCSWALHSLMPIWLMPVKHVDIVDPLDVISKGSGEATTDSTLEFILAQPLKSIRRRGSIVITCPKTEPHGAHPTTSAHCTYTHGFPTRAFHPSIHQGTYVRTYKLRTITS